MSRLDSAIRRLKAQRAALDRAAGLIEHVGGPVFELGLGNGRTYDHLRGILPCREIFVFERQVMAHPDCVPDARHLILGDLRQTLPWARGRFARSVALVHADIGSGDKTASAALAAFLAQEIPPLLGSGAIVTCDQPLGTEALDPLAPPDGVATDRYFTYRARG